VVLGTQVSSFDQQKITPKLAFKIASGTGPENDGLSIDLSLPFTQKVSASFSLHGHSLRISWFQSTESQYFYITRVKWPFVRPLILPCGPHQPIESYSIFGSTA
jgi:hypothetical protein